MFFKLDYKLHEKGDHMCLVQGYVLSAVNDVWQAESLIKVF